MTKRTTRSSTPTAPRASRHGFALELHASCMLSKRESFKLVRNRPASADQQYSEAIREMQTEVSTRQAHLPHAISPGQCTPHIHCILLDHAANVRWMLSDKPRTKH